MNLRFAFLLLFSVLFFTSCIPTKDMIYLQNKNNTPTSTPINQVVSKPYRLQSNDVLSISIKAIDPALVAIFNPTSDGSKVAQDAQSLYFDGFNVDDHGNIRVPILGEINVLGFTVDEVRSKIEKELLATYFNEAANIFY